MRLKIKSPTATKVITVNDDISYKEFIEEVVLNQELFPHPETISSIKKGFPPKPIEWTDDKIIKDDIKSGDQLILEAGSAHSAGLGNGTKSSGGSGNGTKSSGDGGSGGNGGGNNEGTSNKPDIPHVYIPELHQYLILRNIPDDNSCMFNAINYAMKQEPVPELRAICARAIKNDPDKYNEIVLGKSNSQYSEWINRSNSWGGAIELGILSEYLQVAINCIDIELGNFIKFENDAHKPSRFINLIYSGIHYDLLVLNSKLSTLESDKSNDQTIWGYLMPQAELIQSYSEILTKSLQSQNYTTNTTTFRIRCLDCYKVLVGETGASKHANEAGHYNFGEVDNK